MSYPFPQYVTPESRPSSSAATAFASPPSNLRRKPPSSTRGASKAVKTVSASIRSGRFLSKCVTFPFGSACSAFELALWSSVLKIGFWPKFHPKQIGIGRHCDFFIG